MELDKEPGRQRASGVVSSPATDIVVAAVVAAVVIFATTTAAACVQSHDAAQLLGMGDEAGLAERDEDDEGDRVGTERVATQWAGWWTRLPPSTISSTQNT